MLKDVQGETNEDLPHPGVRKTWRRYRAGIASLRPAQVAFARASVGPWIPALLPRGFGAPGADSRAAVPGAFTARNCRDAKFSGNRRRRTADRHACAAAGGTA